MMKEKYRLGVVSVSFRKYTPEEIIIAARDARLSFIEWGSDIHAPHGDRAQLCRIADFQKEYGISTSSYGTYFRLGESPLQELYSYIESAKLLGTDTLRLWCGSKSGADMTEKEKDALFLECQRAKEIAEECKVKLCMECHRSTFTERREDAVRLMKEMASPHIRMYWQPFQWQSVEENIKNAEAISPYALHLHVFNWKGEKKLPLADATDEWRAYLEKFDTPRTLLLEFMPGDTIGELTAEADSLKKIIECIRACS